MIIKVDKVDDNNIKITRQKAQPPIPEPEVNTYNRNEIERQKIENLARREEFAKPLLAQIAANNVQRDIELKEVDEILAEMDKLQTKVKPKTL